LTPKRRNNFNITADILKVCLYGANKTRIVYAANLNYKRVEGYLELCIRLRLLNKQLDGVYRTTTEGARFLKSYFGALSGTERGAN